MTTAVRQAEVFRYEKPDLDHGKATMWLCKTDILSGYIQVLTEGGENNMHSHPTNDGFWFVLGGRARFYGEGDELLGDIGTHEGILIPRGLKYWFESGSDEPLEIMRIGALISGKKDTRVDVTPQTEAVTMSKHLAASAPERAGAATVSRPPDGWER